MDFDFSWQQLFCLLNPLIFFSWQQLSSFQGGDAAEAPAEAAA